MNSKGISTAVLTVFAVACLCIDSPAQDARTIVKESFNYMRGKSSFSVVDMTIHRPNWERKMTIEAWTKGLKNSLFRIIAPAKDKDNGTLKKGKKMWTYNPKVNRVIKLPPSMMSQAWMGSDFSNDDLSKTDRLIDDYTHTITGLGGKMFPKVWRMQKAEATDEYTELNYKKLSFKENLRDNLFTISNLKSPRR